ncbi:MAG: T9SS type A sorting domain-containing protein [Prevotellaceae bacterium]|jgi:hypothetical protein|nr:T9SS type A sorting domain-containing protein [Prevotellaceae bacterium]
MRKNIFDLTKSAMWRPMARAWAVVALGALSILPARATEITSGNCIEYRSNGYIKDYGCFLWFFIRYYNDKGSDNVVKAADIYINGTVAMHLEGWHQNDASGYECNISARNGFYVEAISTSETSWHAIRSGSTARVYDKCEQMAECTVVVFLPQSELNKDISWRYLISGQEYIGNYDRSGTLSGYYFETPTLSADLYRGDGYWDLTGTYPHEQVASSTRELKNGSTTLLSSSGSGTSVDFNSNPADLLCSSASKNLTLVSSLALSVSGLTYTTTSSAVTVGHLQQAQSATLTNNGDGTLTLAWTRDNLAQPNSTSSPYNSSWRVEKKVGSGAWEALAPVSYSSSATTYSVAYTIPESEREKGTQNYQFRVNREYLDAGVLSNTASLSVNTNYVRPISLMFERSTRRIYVKTDNGILSSSTTFGVEATVNSTQALIVVGALTQINSSDANYSQGYTHYFLSNVESCTPSTYKVQTKLGNALVGTAATLSFTYQPDTKRRVRSMTASKGYYNNKVVVKWEVSPDSNQFTSFVVNRWSISDPSAAPKQVALIEQYAGAQFLSVEDGEVSAGAFYRYELVGQMRCDTTLVSDPPLTDIGYAQAFGSASGTVTFAGTSTGVANTDIIFSSSTEIPNKAIDFGNQQNVGYLIFPTPWVDSETAMTLQLWCKLRSDKATGGHQLFYGYNTSAGVDLPQLDIWLDENRQLGYELFGNTAGSRTLTQDTFPLNEYFHFTASITRTRVAGSYSGYTLTAYRNGKLLGELSIATTQGLSFGTGRVSDNELLWKIDGCVDELRVWNRALTASEIALNYNRYIASSSAGLRGYYRFDEPAGVGDQCFDISALNVAEHSYNENHGRLIGNVSHATDSLSVPSPEQLALKAQTSESGSFVADMILPYSTSGTLYTIRPYLGVHQFTPAQLTRSISSTAPNADGLNFEDVSKFTYNGRVVYAGGNYPVAGCSFLVDNSLQMDADMNAIATDANGQFSLSIPVGTHTIKIQKQGHSFVKDTIRKNFQDDELSFANIRFEDLTRVRVVGRVSGGTTEVDKPLGFSESKSNLGVAQIVVVADLPTYSFATDTASITHADGNHSNTYSVEKAANATIKILTNEETGEFYADLYPEKFTITGIKLGNKTGGGIGAGEDLLGGEAMVWDLTEKPLLGMQQLVRTKVDTIIPNPAYPELIQVVETKDSVGYQDTLNYVYRVAPSMVVVELDESSQPKLLSDGVTPYYGEPQFIFRAQFSTQLDTVPLVALDGNGHASYTFGYPVYSQGKVYRYDVSLQERYVNWQTGVAFNAPVADEQIVVQNSMSLADARIRVLLDGEGKTRYSSRVDNPNTTNGLRSLELAYPCVSASCPNFLTEAIVLGGVSTGNNFVTQGPDAVLFVLRDPPGDNSYAYWERQTTVAVTKSYSIEQSFSAGMEAMVQMGTSQHVIQISGIGVAVGTQTDFDFTNDLGGGLYANEAYNEEGKHVTTITTTERIETSSEPDWVGPEADVYVGASTNIIYGYANLVQLADATTAQSFQSRIFTSADGRFQIGLNSGMTLDESFGTSFHFTHRTIEQSLIPEWQRLKSTFLVFQPVATVQAAMAANPSAYPNPVYCSILGASDPNFASLNSNGTTSGNSYTIVYPPSWNEQKKQGYTDSVAWCNKQISVWQKQLAFNERAKLNAKTRALTNYSFGSGVKVDYSVARDTLDSNTKMAGGGFKELTEGNIGFEIAGTGVQAKVHQELEFERKTGGGTDVTNSQTIGFVLADASPSDKLSVDFVDGNNVVNGINLDSIAGGFIFLTRAGQTQCPYEDEYKTKYYNPGTVVNAATMKMENPVLNVTSPSNVSGVPADGKAVYDLQLLNNSEAKADMWYALRVNSATNPNGAVVSLDGKVLTEEGTAIYVPYGETGVKKTLVIERGPRAYDYSGIEVVLASQCQYSHSEDDIYSSVLLSASFLQGCTDLNMAQPLDLWTANTTSGNVMQLKVDGFDRNFANLGYIDLQFKESYSPTWISLRKYFFNQAAFSAESSANKELAGSVSELNYSWDMESRSDGSYNLRAVAGCIDPATFVDISRTSSPVKSGIKDMVRPELFGRPEPKDGVLDVNDEIMVQLNEPIACGRIIIDNVQVTGIKSGARGNHSAAAHFDGSSSMSTQLDATLQSPFTVELWVKRNAVGQDGKHVIFAHANNLEIGFSDDNLYVSANGKSASIEDEITTDEWAHLSVVLNATGVVSAKYAYSSFTLSLENAMLGSYNATGKITLANTSSSLDSAGLAADIHNLCIWNYARTEGELAQNMYAVYNGVESGLSHYYALNEGIGSVAADKAGGLTGQLSSPQWAFENGGRAVSLATGSLAISGANFGFGSKDSYTIELWFKGAAAQNSGLATLFSAGSGDGSDYDGSAATTNDSESKLRLYFDAGKLTLANNSNTYATTASYLDNAWHHLALSVNRLSDANIYVDGELVKTIPATDIGGMTQSLIYLGQRGYYRNLSGSATLTLDQQFSGTVDELRIWNAGLTADVIKHNMTLRQASATNGLVAYYPFENFANQDGTQTLGFSLADASNTTNTAATLGSGATQSAEYAPIKDAGATENLANRYVCNGDKLLITLLEDRSRIEKSLVTIRLADIQDLNGNLLGSSIVWGAYVNQTQLRWENPNLTLDGEPYTAISQTIQITNSGGASSAYTITGIPTWLTLTPSSGTLPALASQTITISAASGVNLGKYSTTLFLNGSSVDQLNLTLNVHTNAPEWSANPALHQYSASVVAQLSIDGALSADVDDQLAVFVGEECRGRANVTYESLYGRYIVYLTVYSDSASGNEPFTFQIWDADKSALREAQTPAVIDFRSGYTTGTIALPVVFSATDVSFFSQPLAQGWTWISLNIAPANLALSSVFAGLAAKTSLVKNATAFSLYEGSAWHGDLATLAIGSMYKVRSNTAATLTFSGTKVDASATPITLTPKWNWLGYTPQLTLTVQEALSGITPADGDLIKSQTAFATYSAADQAWHGDLAILEPGKGYQYSSKAAANKTLTYPSVSAMQQGEERRVRLASIRTIAAARAVSAHFTPVAASEYSGTMSIVAVLKQDGKILTNVELGIFAGTECRGSATSNADGLLFLSVAGEATAALTVKAYSNGQTTELTAAQNLTYTDDAVMGSIASPHVFTLASSGSETGIADNGHEALIVYPNPVDAALKIEHQTLRAGDKIEIYSLSGTLVKTFVAAGSKSVLDVSSLASGTYIVKAGGVVAKVVKR